MTTNGRVVFGQMEEVRFGIPAAEAVAEQVARMGAQRVFLMVSGTLARSTDEIEKIRRALGNKCVGVFDRMPAHSPRKAVIEAAEQARAANTDLIVTVGGGSITDAAKAVQLCLSNRHQHTGRDGRAAHHRRRVARHQAADRASGQRADHFVRRRVFRHRRRHR